MDYSKKQKELDVKKWNDSLAKCHDTCGEYGYCKNCNKSSEYPCAYAYESYSSNDGYQTSKVSTAKKAASKTTAKKTTTTAKSSAKKTTTAKKITAKKTTSKKVTA